MAVDPARPVRVYYYPRSLDAARAPVAPASPRNSKRARAPNKAPTMRAGP